MELENLDYEIKYLKGSDNAEADYLSRIEGSDLPRESEAIYNLEPDEAAEVGQVITKAQQSDAVIKRVVDSIQKGEAIKQGPFKGYSNLNVRKGLLCKGTRIVIP